MIFPSEPTTERKQTTVNTVTKQPISRPPKSRPLTTVAERKAWRGLTGDILFLWLYERLDRPDPPSARYQKGRRMKANVLTAFGELLHDRSLRDANSVDVIYQRACRRIRRGCYGHLFN